MAAATSTGKRAVLWFRNDLRLHDNGILAEAAKKIKDGQLNEVRTLSSVNHLNH